MWFMTISKAPAQQNAGLEKLLKTLNLMESKPSVPQSQLIQTKRQWNEQYCYRRSIFTSRDQFQPKSSRVAD
jgi:hypothetical protein